VVSPDAQVDVDDVVVGHREPEEAVRDREGAPLVRGPVVPDDADAVVDARDPEAVGQAEAAKLCVGAGPVAGRALADRDLVDRFAAANGNVSVGAAERACEVEGDLLANEERAVRLDLREDVGGRERI
jgi:riboflavin biosynthesis pyrimidine reductase